MFPKVWRNWYVKIWKCKRVQCCSVFPGAAVISVHNFPENWDSEKWWLPCERNYALNKHTELGLATFHIDHIALDRVYWRCSWSEREMKRGEIITREDCFEVFSLVCIWVHLVLKFRRPQRFEIPWNTLNTLRHTLRYSVTGTLK